ncbi:MAG: outer membrane beta-barrel protein [Ignavibacteriae bacterium]|nr:outer membrane beta-barrel protein [Ignavibacteriota bacterium]
MKKSFVIIILMVIFLFKSGISQTPLRASILIGASLPLSEFANQYDGGLSFEGGLFYKVPKTDMNITLTAGYNRFNYNKAYFNDLVLKNLGLTTENFTFKWKAEDIPVMLGARIKFPSGKLTPYIGAEAGIHFLKISDRFRGDTIKVGATVPNVFYFNGVETASETGFGFAFNFGLEYELYPKVNIDVNVKYNYSKINITKTYNVFMTQSLQFTAPPLEKFNSFSLRAGLLVDL